MWIAVIGSLGSGKQKIASMIEKKEGADFYKESKDIDLFQNFEREPNKYSFQNQIDLLVKKFTLFQEINRRMNNTNIVSVGILEEIYLFSEFLVDQQLMTWEEFVTFKKVYDSMVRAVQPPSILIYLKTNIIDTHIRKELERNTDYFTRNEFIEDLDVRYTQFVRTVAIPMVEVNLSEDFDKNWNEVEAGINSIKTARLQGQTLWNKQLTR